MFPSTMPDSVAESDMGSRDHYLSFRYKAQHVDMERDDRNNDGCILTTVRAIDGPIPFDKTYNHQMAPYFDHRIESYILTCPPP